MTVYPFTTNCCLFIHPHSCQYALSIYCIIADSDCCFIARMARSMIYRIVSVRVVHVSGTSLFNCKPSGVTGFLCYRYQNTAYETDIRTAQQEPFKFPCHYCPKLVFEYPQHLTTYHRTKRAVAAIFLKPKQERKQKFWRASVLSNQTT
jgi:hypothetical protein